MESQFLRCQRAFKNKDVIEIKDKIHNRFGPIVFSLGELSLFLCLTVPEHVMGCTYICADVILLCLLAQVHAAAYSITLKTPNQEVGRNMGSFDEREVEE